MIWFHGYILLVVPAAYFVMSVITGLVIGRILSKRERQR